MSEFLAKFKQTVLEFQLGKFFEFFEFLKLR